MTDAHSLTSLPEDEARQILETVFHIAIHMEHIAAMLRRNQLEHGTAEMAAARKAGADELMAAADMIHTKGPPEKSRTEIVIHGIHEDMTEEQIAHILGGGRWVRMVRLRPHMAFVSYWTEKGQLRGIKDGPRWIREEGWMAKHAERANFNPKYHMFEIDETKPYPPFSPYPEKEDRQGGTGQSEGEGGWTSSSMTTTTEYWHQRSLPRTSMKRKSIQE
jgi:hypothetical protein